jgi:hypothetical protein
VRWALPVLAAVTACRASGMRSLRLASRRVFGELLADMLYLDTVEMLNARLWGVYLLVNSVNDVENWRTKLQL